MNIYFKLFMVFFKIGLFGFGGGYAMLPLIQEEIVATHAWLSLEQFADIVAISQMTPGPIAINSATFVGYLLTDSWIGSAIATFGVCLPPFIIMLSLSRFYLRLRNGGERFFYWLKPAVVGLIGAAAIAMLNEQNFIDAVSLAIFAGVFVGAMKKLDPIKLILAAGIAGILVYS